MSATPEIRILIVEDDVYFQRILQKRLEAEGYRVGCAADGRDGMKMIVTWDPHLVISDWMMPHVDGLELCQSVKTGLREAAPYFILLTAKGEISDRLLGLETGADDYLVKPCDQGEIMARVRAGLRSVLLSRDLASTKVELARVRSELEAARAELLRRNEGTLQCGSCKRVQTPAGEWREPDADRSAADPPPVAASTCPECAANTGAVPDQRAA